MKPVNFILFVAIACLLFSCGDIGCEYTPKDATCLSEHYVTRYYKPYYGYVYLVGEDVLHVKFVMSVDSRGERDVNISSKGDDALVFDSLARKHRDLFYNDMVMFSWWADSYGVPRDSVRSYYNIASFADILSIDVTTETAWDDAHPAGASLNDIIVFSGTSFRDYILGGYIGRKLNPIKKCLSDMTAFDYQLVIHTDRIGESIIDSLGTMTYSPSGTQMYDDHGFDLICQSMPIEPGAELRRVVVTVTFDDGTVEELRCRLDH